MKKMQITADVELQSVKGKINIHGTTNDLNINISSASVVIFPLKTYLLFRKYIILSKFIDQNIAVMIANKKIVSFDNGKMVYSRRWWLFKFLLTALIKKGI
ncbi:hypothetical protein [Marivirga harenae]|uniref:hypothetical protein n=1 Tax=Marivirga harenae TaxID=2010992 RepID=UPI0026E0A401|nr:hypothetical protein [Marivirga harenae]WKV12154.1 hypothetical protein Q3Y49_18315 [Marivirga harenae]|tara:strand:+ start:277223 stop:277525 length:303 start_codon:yes stop_codon:yes gene_type:complete